MPRGVPKNGLWRGREPVSEWVARIQATAPRCACGCDEIIVVQPHHRAYGLPEYVHGHHARAWDHQAERHPNWKRDRMSLRAGRNGRYFIPSVKRAIGERDKWQCRICGSKDALNFDHVIAVRDGGDGTVGNGQLLCASCHKTKTKHERRARRQKGKPSCQ